MRASRILFAIVVSLLAVTLVAPGPALAARGVVQVVLFHSPTCSHCIQVINEDLPPMQARYGSQLQVLEVDVTQPEGRALYNAAIERFQIPEERQGYPMAIVGQYILLGSVEIPEQLPGLIDAYLAQGGVAWPDIPGLEGAAPAPPLASLTWWERAARDPVGSALAVAVLLGLVAALVAVARPHAWQGRLAQRLPWAAPAVAVLGLAVAFYLSFVEVSQQSAFCGPVGDCNAVQQSRFALLFGFLPVGVFGALGYIAILCTLALARLGQGRSARLAAAGVFLLAGFGALFSAYLTFLEPFVIGAVCLWCLTSAVCMVLLLVLSAGPGWTVLQPPPETTETEVVAG